MIYPIDLFEESEMDLNCNQEAVISKLDYTSKSFSEAIACISDIRVSGSGLMIFCVSALQE